MTLYVLLGITAAALICAPFVLAFKLGKAWNLERKIFWKAGLAFVVIQIFLSTVISNSVFFIPQGPSITNILLYALVAALTLELGRFLVLDKLMKNVRSFLKGVYFGLGWGGIMMIFFGMGVAVSIFGIDLLMQTEDLSTLVPENSGITVAEIASVKEQLLPMLFNFPYLALLPIIERASWLFIDVALTILILFGISTGASKYIWGAVLMRGILTFATVYLASYSDIYIFIQTLIFMAFAVISYFIIRKMEKLFSERRIA
jgi:uncharacterized membrane protein YhfC